MTIADLTNHVGSATNTAFRGSGRRLGGTTTHQSQSRLLKSTVSTTVDSVVKTVAPKVAPELVAKAGKVVLNEIASTCTRSQACAKTTQTLFGKGVDSSAQIAKKITQAGIKRLSSKTAKKVLKVAGPAVAIAVEMPTVVEELSEGQVLRAGITVGSIGVGLAASSQAAVYCAPGGPAASIVCAIGASMITSAASQSLKETVQPLTSASESESEDGEVEFDFDHDPVDDMEREVLKFVQDERLEELSKQERARRIIQIIIENYFMVNNRFMPSYNSARLLTRHNIVKQIGTIDSLSGLDWMELMTEDVLFSVHGPQRQQVLNDQRTRARAIVKTMLEQRKTTLLMMDGHGRFTWMCMLELRKQLRKLDKVDTFADYTFALVDKSIGVTRWHQNFMPDNVEVIVNERGHSGDVFNEHPSNDNQEVLLYLNFCGLGEMVEKVEWQLMRYLSHGRTVFLSYGSRGVGKEGKTQAIIFRNWLLNNDRPAFKSTIDKSPVLFDQEEVSKRGNFHTYKLTPRN